MGKIYLRPTEGAFHFPAELANENMCETEPKRKECLAEVKQ